MQIEFPVLELGRDQYTAHLLMGWCLIHIEYREMSRPHPPAYLWRTSQLKTSSASKHTATYHPSTSIN